VRCKIVINNNIIIIIIIIAIIEQKALSVTQFARFRTTMKSRYTIRISKFIQITGIIDRSL